ncbi:type II toxin-antitoxin system VapC family toxin [Nocardia pseudovaccinii]|uniref:type II toxin-antitoxin system VapC family toxin n=1 Tax=Nocardia pseudovaccinii TaxID=189540 RepID=UPI0007A4457F|nr:type II toxin-antitoxin system VapC family toxin [Nocardia pseudovaccinii]
MLRTLRKAVLGNHLTADAAFRALAAMQIVYVGTDVSLLHTVWAMRHNVSVYDAAYLAVAVLHDAPLTTFDARLAKAAEQTQTRHPRHVALIRGAYQGREAPRVRCLDLRDRTCPHRRAHIWNGFDFDVE